MENATASADPVTPTYHTFEVDLDGVPHTALTRVAPGELGRVVLRVKRRGRPSYFTIQAAVPTDAKVLKGEPHPSAVNLLNADA